MNIFDALTSAPGDINYEKCSRKGCMREASWQLLWNNPKVHTADRRKVWLACDEHKEYLVDFLVSRGFLKAVEPLTEASV